MVLELDELLELLDEAGVLVPLFDAGFVFVASFLTVPLFETGEEEATASFEETSLFVFLVTTVFLFPFS